MQITPELKWLLFQSRTITPLDRTEPADKHRINLSNYLRIGRDVTTAAAAHFDDILYWYATDRADASKHTLRLIENGNNIFCKLRVE